MRWKPVRRHMLATPSARSRQMRRRHASSYHWQGWNQDPTRHRRYTAPSTSYRFRNMRSGPRCSPAASSASASSSGPVRAMTWRGGCGGWGRELDGAGQGRAADDAAAQRTTAAARLLCERGAAQPRRSPGAASPALPTQPAASTALPLVHLDGVAAAGVHLAALHQVQCFQEHGQARAGSNGGVGGPLAGVCGLRRQSGTRAGWRSDAAAHACCGTRMLPAAGHAAEPCTTRLQEQEQEQCPLISPAQQSKHTQSATNRPAPQNQIPPACRSTRASTRRQSRDRGLGVCRGRQGAAWAAGGQVRLRGWRRRLRAHGRRAAPCSPAPPAPHAPSTHAPQPPKRTPQAVQDGVAHKVALLNRPAGVAGVEGQEGGVVVGDQGLRGRAGLRGCEV